MREIKFRAWDKEQNCMLSSKATGLIIHFDGTVNAYDSEGTLIGTEFINELEVMQYTGLKDKYGKDIYEGDIIRYEHSAVGSIVRVVQYKYGMYGVEGNVKGTQIPFANILDSTREVIGNIYENPELLEG